MATIAEAPQQRKQPSRKGKKAWRKNVDVSDVQTGLEGIRDEVIHGGVVADKAADELFAVDIAGSADIKKEVAKHHKPLKADEILAQRSAVPAVDSRKRSSKITDGIIEPSSKRHKVGKYVSHKELQRLKSIAHGGDTTEKDVVQTDATATHDPWAMEDVKQDPRFSFLPEKKPIREPETLKHSPVVLSASGKPFPAVKKPEAGKSYNPTFEEWNAVLAREGEKEVEAEKKRLREEEEDRLREERAAAAAAESDPESDGNESAWESEWEGIQSEAEDSYLKQKRPERKTPQQRNKAKRRKEAERQAKWEAQMKKQQEQADRIKQLAKEIEEKEKLKKEQALLKKDDESSEDEEETVRRRKFGKAPVPEAPLEVVLPDELQDSLRLLKPEGNLIKDRYRNMILRGKIESRKGSQRKQPKTTVTEKWSYKDWTLAKAKGRF
ncbi:putative 60s ribosome subunit biogenesis protein nop53 [Diplodia seriata]|uniref:Ribosome biogenesis protein NOP53 n=1 Tax=Diplodia seriata TaxID=420778 RepID=A0A0G2GQY1_9PEZI|nr:putative 60s ribosome subunit biogenesis protein nop53 [Diplodia seriata]